MSNEIFISSEKIVRNYLDLIKKLPEELDITSKEFFGILRHSFDNSNELNDHQRQNKERGYDIFKRKNAFLKGYSRDHIALLFIAYQYGKELNTLGENFLSRQFKEAGGREAYFYFVVEDIQHSTSAFSKEELIDLLTPLQDWIVKESLEQYLKEFA